MKKLVAALPLLSLAACGGAGLETVGSNAAPTGSNGTTPGATEAHSFVKPTATKTYQAVGAAHSLSYNLIDDYEYEKKTVTVNGAPVLTRDNDTRTMVAQGRGAELYVSEVGTVRGGAITVTYDPKNAIYEVVLGLGNVQNTARYQDPAHHTAFGGASEPQAGVPNFEATGQSNANWRDKGVQYYELFQGTDQNYDSTTFFAELPGTSTKYVTYAGYVRNFIAKGDEVTLEDTDALVKTRATARRQFDRAAFVFGENTPTSDVPRSGTASYSGNMIASMIVNPTMDDPTRLPSYFQWMGGTANVNVNFGTSAVTASLSGTTLAPFVDRGPILSPSGGLENRLPGDTVIPAGATFTASGTATIDLVGKGGFTGGFDRAGFAWSGGGHDIDIVGSSLTGAFYGPKAAEVGGAFRIVGGVPDQRVDVLGSFTGR